MEQQFRFARSARKCELTKTGADGAVSKARNFEPGRPPDIARRPFHGNQTSPGTKPKPAGKPAGDAFKHKFRYLDFVVFEPLVWPGA
jgi:hypothetical protein